MPIGYLIIRTIGTGPGEWWELVWTPRVGRLTATTLLLAAVVGFAATLLAGVCAFLVTRTDLPFRRFFAVLMALPLAIPSYVAAFNWLTVGNLWGSPAQFDGFWSAVVVLTLYSTPYVFLPVAAAMAQADVSQEEVARSLGHSPVSVLLRVTLPQVSPAVAGGLLLVVLYVLSDFGAVAILRVDTFTRAIFTAFSAGFDRQSAFGLSTVLLLITVLFLLIEAIVRRRGARLDTIYLSHPRTTLRLGKARWAVFAVILAGGVLTLGVPIASTIDWFLEGTSRPDSAARLISAALGSVGVSAAGALTTVVLALPLGVLAAHAPGRIARWTERAAYLGHSLPGVVVGLSLVYLGINLVRPLYQTTWLLAFAYATLFIPLALASIATAAAKASPGLLEAAASLGVGPLARFRRITVPLLTPGLGAGAALAFLACMKELPATLMLRPTGLHTLATELWGATTYQRYAEAAPYAVLLILLAAVPMWVLVHRAGIVGKAAT
ncbi:ABC transporter permease [Enemella sp. A6]|uniref:ABC transporter permease n=1 Tax=Enemella sp. A6 TaxID=3440152 RepID=UPI003EC1499F